MQSIVISLDIDEVVYDIQNKTYLTGKSRSEGDNHEQVANMQANDDEENLNQVLRSVQCAFAQLKTKLGEYLNLPAERGDNVLMERDKALSLSLMMPSNFNSSTVDTIAAAAHQYVVSVAVCDWFTITCKKDAPEYSALAASALRAISEAVNKRVRPERPAK